MSSLDRLEKIFNRYDGEYDCIPHGPDVTWAENLLAECLADALERVSILESKINCSATAAGRVKPARRSR